MPWDSERNMGPRKLGKVEAMFEKNRKRRLIFNDDSDQQYVESSEHYGYRVTDAQSFLNARTTHTFDSHVDTYVWCVGNGCEPPWNSMDTLNPCFSSHAEPTDLVIAACHENGIEVWGSLRMNDVHDSFAVDDLKKANDPLKAEHPEYLLAPEESRHLPKWVSERYLWTAFNFAVPEVRGHRLEYIQKNASQHDFDGYELDFTRFVWYFPLGRERKYVPLMTDLVRKTRERLNAIGTERGRPYTLVAHVPDSPLTCLDLGLDVATWLADGLVDVLVVGMGYVVYTMDLGEWQALARPYGVPVCPSLNVAVFTQKYVKPPDKPMVHESMRAISAYWWQEGADGICLFNLFALQDEYLGGFSEEYAFAPLPALGDPALLKGKDKVYGIQPASDRSTVQQGSEGTPLPTALDFREHELPLFMGPDAEDPEARISVRASTRGGDDGTRVWFRLNHTLLEPERGGGWWSADVPRGVMRSGRNKLAIWCDADLTEAETPLIVQRVTVPVTYS